MSSPGPHLPPTPEPPRAPGPLPAPGSRLRLSRGLRVAGASLLALGLALGALSFAHADPVPEAVPGFQTGPLTDPIPEVDPPGPNLVDAERALVQAHLAEVEAALRAAPTDHLDATQRANRAALLDELRAYRLAGSFPRNREVAGRSPVFVDEDGVHCAVGYLLHRSGEDGLVATIAEARNHARIFDLVDEPALVTWLHASGLSAVEAAWIQPAYCSMQDGAGVELSWCSPWPNPGRDELSREYLALTVGTSTLGAALAAVNFLDLGAGRPSSGRGLLGMGVGAAGVGIGAAGILEGGDARRAGWVNVAFGVLGAGSGAWTFHRARVIEAEAPAGRPIVAGIATGPTLSIRPWVSTGAAGANPEAVGLRVRIAH